MMSPLQTRRLLGAGFFLLCAAFLILASRRSYEAEVLGWWSLKALAFVLAALVVLVIVGLVVFAALRNDERLAKFDALLVSLRRKKLAVALLTILPPIAWLAIIWYVMRLGVQLTFSLAAGLVDLALLALVWETLLAFGGLPPKERRQLAMKWTLAGMSLLLTLLMLEAVGNTLGLEAYVDWDTNPKWLNARFQTDDFDVRVITNGQGLREPEMIDPLHEETYRVVAIGDSFTFGWGVESDESYPKVAQSLLRTQYGCDDVEIINMGKPGRSPAHYLKFIREYASRLNPDLIVVGLLVTDDGVQIAQDVVRDETDPDRAYEKCLAASRVNPIQSMLLKSCIARLVYSKLLPRLRSLGEVHGTGMRGPIFAERNPLDPALLNDEIQRDDEPQELWSRYDQLKSDGWVEKGLNWRVNPWLVKSMIFHPDGAIDSVLFDSQTEPLKRQQWRLCVDLLVEMESVANSYGAELVVMAIPVPHLVSPRWIGVLEEWGCPVSQQMTETDTVFEWLRQDCREKGLQYFDALEECRGEVAAGQVLYFDTDAHMKPVGNQLLGEMLAAKLAEIRREATGGGSDGTDQ